MKHLNYVLSALFAVMLLSAVTVSAQNYPDTLWVPVTYYDFHSDGSNPEFEMDHNGGVMTGLIHDTLDSEGKPISTQTYLNWYIKYWYRDWADSAQGDNTSPSYNSSGNFINISDVGHDTSFKNIVINDSLPFEHLGAGVYQYWNDDFFPLDGRGFGNEAYNHNFSFAMELKTTFIMKEGLTFNFRGDDDVWAFVNGELVMDLGNLHSAANGEFDTDTLGLTVGQEYDFDFFFAERHTYGSHIRITTNIVSTHIVTEVEIIADPATATIPAGDSVHYTGLVHYDSTDGNGTVHDLIDTTLSQNITWTLISDNPSSDPTQSSILPATGMNSVFTTTLAYETFKVVALYEDPVTHQITTDTATITIIPDDPDHIVAEASSDTTTLAKKQNDTPMDTLVINAVSTTGNAYGIIRDQFGNFVDYSQNSTWLKLAGTVISDPSVGIATLGQGIITKTGFSGTGTVSVKDNFYYNEIMSDDLKSDSLKSVQAPLYLDSFVVRVINDVPVANDDNYSINEDQTLIVPSAGHPSILDNDNDNLPLTAILVSNVTVGNLNFASDGSGNFTYVPPLNYNGNATFTYKVSDGQFESNVATVTIVIGADNDKPIAVNDVDTTSEDTPLSIAAPGVLLNDSDIDGDALTALQVTNVNPAAGSVTLNANGSFVYTPALNFNGTATFTYQANDGALNSDVATVAIIVTPVNDAPNTNPDNYSMNEDATLTVNVGSGLKANDSDPEGDPFSVFLVTNVSHGTLNLVGDGSFLYNPAQDSTGTVTFTYKATDGTDTSGVETVTITINPVNDNPIAVADLYSVAEDNVLNVPVNGVLANDIDVEGSALTATLQNDVDPSTGTLNLNGNGSFVFTPVANFNGPAYFTYIASDGTGSSNSILVTINVTPVNDAPVANDDAYSTGMNDSLVVSLPGVMLNDNDIDLDILKTIKLSDPVLGTLTFNENGSFLYVPATNDVGTHTFEYQLSDGALYDTATVTLYVGLNNTAPIAVVDSYTVVEDNVLTVSDSSAGLLGNDLDSAADILSANLVSGIDPSEGTLVLNNNGTFTYTPALNLTGVVTFTYQANDSKLNSNIVTVYITVTPVNDKPVAVNDNYSMNEDATLTVTIGSGVLQNDTDPDGDDLSAVLVTGVNATQGTLTLNVGGNFTFTPAKDLTGAVTFTYKAVDDSLASDTATVTITINPVNDIPIIDSIPVQIVDKGTPFDTIFIDSVITDVDDNTSDLTITIDSTDNLVVTIDPITGTIIVEPIDSNWTGTEIVTITVTDPGGQTVTQDVIFIINKKSTLPVPSDNVVLTTDTALTVQFYVEGFQDSGATIPYSLTESQSGTTPADPTITPTDIMNGVDTLVFGPYEQDSMIINVTAYSKLYPYESSSNGEFTYMLIHKQLPDLLATEEEGIYDTSDLLISLYLDTAVVTLFPDTIWYTLDGSDPLTSSTKKLYDGSILLSDTLLTQITVKAVAIKKYYKNSETELIFTLNPQKLPKPIADPAGGDYFTNELAIWLYTVGDPLNTADYDIRYTLDGSVPDKSSSKFVGDSIRINDNTTLIAVVLDTNQNPGPQLIEVYNLHRPTEIIVVTDTSDTVGSDVITVIAGTLQDVKAKILDQDGIVIPDSLLDSNLVITWDLQEVNGTNSATLDTTKGIKNVIIPDKAHNTVTITVTYILGSVTFDKTVTIFINPGVPYSIYLEPTPDKLVSPNDKNEVDTLKLSPSTSSALVYAVLRDSLDNYVSASQKTIWTSDSVHVASVASGNSTQGQGVITKQSALTNNTLVHGQDTSVATLFNKKDDVYVQVLEYWYDSLKIVVRDSIQYGIDSIVFNTNLDSAIQVFGLVDTNGSDTIRWEKVSAQWVLVDKSLDYIIANPGVGHQYLLDPVDTASGRISVTLGDDTLTIPDTIFAKFTPGGPEKIVIEIITPDSLLIAGEPIKAVVKLLNGDNKEIYGDFDIADAIYGDLFDLDSNLTDKPLITVGDSTYNLIHYDDNAVGYIKQIFIGSSDTVSFTLFHTKDSDDSVHQITVDFGLSTDNNLSIIGNTKPFTLLAADSVHSIGIFVDGVLADTVEIFSGKGEALKAHAIDQYGNKGKTIAGNWSNSVELKNILFPNNTSQIFYEPGITGEDIFGMIYVENSLDATMKDSIVVWVKPQPAKTTNLITQDSDGNGYLDAFIITFDIGVELDSVLIQQIIDGKNIDITNDGDTFTVVGIEEVAGSDGKQFKIIVDEIENGNPQTGWTPEITIGGLEVINIADIDSAITAEDGAAPVVWKVVNKLGQGGDASKNLIQVTFSEDITSSDGLDYDFGSANPNDVLVIWQEVIADDGSITYVKIDNIIDNIGNFTKYDENTKTLEFVLTNDKALDNNYLISLKDSESVTADGKDGSIITDANKNLPDLNSKKVSVVVSGVQAKLKVGPNPAKASLDAFNELKADFKIYDLKKGKELLVKHDGGMLIQVDIPISLTDEEVDSLLNKKGSFELDEIDLMSGQQLVFDATGNLVFTREEKNITISREALIELVSDGQLQGKVLNAIFYWHCFTDFGMPAKPGVYKNIIYADVKIGAGAKPIKLSKIIAIKK